MDFKPRTGGYLETFSEAGSPVKGCSPVAGKSSLLGENIRAIASLKYSTKFVNFCARPFITITFIPDINFYVLFGYLLDVWRYF
jgi:hypothetical protein